MDTEPMIIEALLPVCDVSVAEHRVVEADAETAYEAARDLDFATVHTPLLDAAFFVRTLPARLRGRPAPAPEHLQLDGLGDGLPGWRVLGQVHGREIAFGAVGVFWRAEFQWRDVEPSGFAAFDEPGNGKIACNFSVHPYGARRSVLTFDCRVAGTDEASRRAIGRYWLLIRPFVGHVMRAALAAAAADARAPRRPGGDAVMRTAHVVAAGALTVGGITAAAAPVAAGTDPAGPAVAPPMVAGTADWRDRPGFCGSHLLDRPSGVLDPAARADLRRIAARTALTRDLAAAFADRYPAWPAAVVRTQAGRLAMLLALLDRYAIGPAGPPGRAEHDRLLARGRTGRAAALDVLRDLERRTAADLTAALGRTTAPDVRHTYLHLLVAANRQLRGWQAWHAR